MNSSDLNHTMASALHIIYFQFSRAGSDGRKQFEHDPFNPVPVEELQQAGGNQLILDGLDARRTLWMVCPHVVLEACGMGNVGSVHGDLLAPDKTIVVHIWSDK